jgi:hypothetical protein
MGRMVRPLPLRSDVAFTSRRDPAPYVKAVTALLIAAIHKQPVEPVIKRTYGGDRQVELITRAAVSSHTTTSLDEFTQTQGLDIISVLGPSSAGAALLNGGIKFEFANNLGIYIANITAASGNAGFVAEINSPIPVRQLTLDNNTLVPRSLKVITTFTREVVEHSVPTIERLVQTALADSTALQFDSALMDAAAADTSRPAGLRQGIAGATASSSTNRAEAMMADLETLIGGVASIANNGPIAIVASPQKATALRLAPKASPFPFPIYATSGLASGIVCAVALNSLVSAFDPQPMFSTSIETTLVMQDTAPGEFSTAGTPAVVSSPLRSMFQTDTIALRMVMQCAWGLRNAGGLSWLTTTAW